MNTCLTIPDRWVVGSSPTSYVLLFNSLATFIIVDQFLLGTLLPLAPRKAVLCSWPRTSLATPQLAVFSESVQILVLEWARLKLRLDPFSVYNRLLADLIHSPDLNTRLTEAWTRSPISTLTYPAAYMTSSLGYLTLNSSFTFMSH